MFWNEYSLDKAIVRWGDSLSLLRSWTMATSHISKSFPLTFSCNIYFLSCNLNSLFFVAWGITGSVCIYIYLCFWFWWYSVLQALSNYNSGGEETALYMSFSLSTTYFSPCHLRTPKLTYVSLHLCRCF